MSESFERLEYLTGLARNRPLKTAFLIRDRPAIPACSNDNDLRRGSVQPTGTVRAPAAQFPEPTSQQAPLGGNQRSRRSWT